MKKVKIFFIFSVFLSLLAMAACGSDGSSSDTEAEDITLELAYWTQDTGMEEILEHAIEIYNDDHEHVEITFTSVPFDNYWTRMQTSLSGGQGPDILLMDGRNYLQLASLGLLENLNSYIEDSDLDMSVYPDGMNNLYKYEEEHYAIPFVMGPMALYYNKEIFDEAGVDYPDESWTWEDVEEYGGQLADNEDGTYGFIVDTTTFTQQAGLFPLVHQAGGSIISDDKTESGFGTPETTEAIQFLQTLTEEGISPPVSTLQETQAKQMFGSERGAMYTSGSYDVSFFSESLGDKLGVSVLPQHKQKGYPIHGSAFSVNANSEYKEEAFEFIKVLTGYDTQEFLGEIGSNFPAHMEVVEVWEQSHPELELSAFREGLDDTVPYPSSLTISEWQEIVTSELTSGISNNTPAEEVSQTIEEQMNEILEEENR
ncbi:ABC transporter substrate-binding protein [Salibacterium aidingense]|uniref:ABC transporter substrate-binding protein n=1 Tax=Salibacterium aidingense TaxID=384933 RepID=UPI003BC2772B